MLNARWKQVRATSSALLLNEINLANPNLSFMPPGLEHKKVAHRSKGRQNSPGIPLPLQLSQQGQPITKSLLQFELVKWKVIMQLSQMHPRAHRVQQLPDPLQPSEAAVAQIGIPSWPHRCDPWLPNRIAVNEGRLPRINLSRGFPQLLCGNAAVRVGALLHQLLQFRKQPSPAGTVCGAQ